MSLFDDDPELLRAALEIIDAWDADNTGDSISVRSTLTDGSDSATEDRDSAVELHDAGDDAATQPHATIVPSPTMRLPPLEVSLVTRERKPSNVPSTRQRRREEIVYLRDKVKEMEGQLALLEKVRKENNASKNSTTDTDKAVTAMWHDIASRQQRMRQKSELDQAKLRKLLETQIKVAEGLVKLMQKARRMDEDEAFPQIKRMKLTSRSGVGLDETEQIARLHSHYDNLDAEFAFHKFHDGSLKFVDIDVTNELEKEVIIEYREAWTLPFDLDCVLDAMWQYTLKKNHEKWSKPDRHASTTVRSDGTEVVSRFAATSTVCGFLGSFNGQVITKRFDGQDETGRAIITVIRADPDPVSPGDIEGFSIRDNSVIRVLPVVKEAREIETKRITMVQYVQRFEMRFEEDARAARQAAGAITNMILDKLKDDIDMKHDTVETLLLCSRSR